MSERRLRNLTLADGRRLSYTEYGAPSGRPLLYMHGGMCTSLDLAFADDQLAALGIRVIAPDRPGMGVSTRSPGRQVRDIVSDLAALLESLELSLLPILGWSLGVPFTLACAADLPQIERAVIMGSIRPPDVDYIKTLGMLTDRILLSAPRNQADIYATALYAFGKLPPSLIKAELIRQAGSEVDRKILRELPDRYSADFVKDALLTGGTGVMDDYLAVAGDWGFKLSDVTIPVDIFHGKLDLICPPSGARYLLDRLPDARLRLIDDAGHFLLQKHLPEIVESACK